jgi:hypothetical protein
LALLWNATQFALEIQPEFRIIGPESKEPAMRSSNITISFLLAQALLISSAEAAIHYVDVNSTNPVPPYLSWDMAAVTIQDAETSSIGGDEILVTNGVYQSGSSFASRISIGAAKFVHSVNGPDVTVIQGYQPPGTTNGSGSIRCAFLRSGVTLAGFTLIHGAAPGGGGGVYANSGCIVSSCNIGFNTANPGGGVFLLGGTLSNCKIHDNFSQANGGGVYSPELSPGLFGTMVGCTFSNNFALSGGGGAFQGTNISCVFFGNQAVNGGGTYNGSLNNCLLVSNVVTGLGGGAYSGGMTNCLLLGNSASKGGGAYDAFTVNCTVVSNSAATAGGVWFSNPAGLVVAVLNDILYWNSATTDPDFHGDNFTGTPVNLAWCCIPTGFGDHSISNAPLFVDAVHRDFRLSPDSPCVNGGRNSYIANSTDMDGNPRIVGGTVDIGAYEFQNPHSVISYGWLQNHGLPSDGSADYADTDNDGMNNWQEWVTNTDPTNSLAYLHMLAPDGTNNAAGVTVHWQSAGIRYFLQRSTNLAGPFATFATNLYAGVSIATYRDATATNTGPYFYRVGVQP